MLIHLIFALIRLATKDPTANISRRKRRGAQVAYLCPGCAALGTATEIFLEEKRGNRAPWLPDKTHLECDACRRSFDARAFENDGNGILQVRNDPCPFCQTLNPATLYVCKWCQKRIG